MKVGWVQAKSHADENDELQGNYLCLHGLIYAFSNL